MPKMYLSEPGLSDYAPVADRIRLFYERYPTGRIVTQLHSRTDAEIIFIASAYRDADDERPAATGWASEREGDGDVNTVACLENTETSAVGRALANLGFTASTRRPSREEMEKAARVRARMRDVSGYPPADAGARNPGAAKRRGSAELQAKADTITDLLLLLQSARRAGLRAHHADWIEERLRSDHVADAMLERIGRRLRRWIAASVDRQLAGFSEFDAP